MVKTAGAVGKKNASTGGKWVHDKYEGKGSKARNARKPGQVVIKRDLRVQIAQRVAKAAPLTTGFKVQIKNLGPKVTAADMVVRLCVSCRQSFFVLASSPELRESCDDSYMNSSLRDR